MSRRMVTSGLFALLGVSALLFGWCAPTERYITPQRGVGYALGIIGGSLMLLLLLYSARKRVRWLRFLGPTAGWFRFHMVLGILGPLCILYHANFRLGAANSNVALISMLTVAASGVVGRYIYAHIHHGLYGRKLTLAELQRDALGVREAASEFACLPELVDRLQATERTVLTTGPHLPVLSVAKVVLVSMRLMVARLGLRSYIRRELRPSAAAPAYATAQSLGTGSGSLTDIERTQLRRAAFGYVDRRLAAIRSVSQFQAYERLFSLWHALHLPLIFMLLVAAVVHVIAVNVY